MTEDEMVESHHQLNGLIESIGLNRFEQAPGDSEGQGGLACCIPRGCKESFSRVRLFATPRTAARQATLSITNSRSSLKLMSIKSVMPTNHLISVIPFSSCLQSFPASGSFPMNQFFASGGQSTGASASASALPMNSQG